MTTDPREETLCLLEENIKAKVLEGAKIPTKPEHQWRDIPDLIRRLVTAIPLEHTTLIRGLQEYSNMISRCAPFLIKAAYTRDMPLQIMRLHVITIMEAHHIPIVNTQPWTIDLLWHSRVVEIFHSLRYDNETTKCPYACTNPCVDDL